MWQENTSKLTKTQIMDGRYALPFLGEDKENTELMMKVFEVNEEQAEAIYRLALGLSSKRQHQNPLTYAHRAIMTDCIVAHSFEELYKIEEAHPHHNSLFTVRVRDKWFISEGVKLTHDEIIKRDLWYTFTGGCLDWREHFVDMNTWGRQALIQDFCGFGINMMFHPVYDHIDWSGVMRDLEEDGYIILEDVDTGYACLFRL